MTIRALAAASLLTVLLLAFGAPAALANGFTVNATDDNDGACTTTHCSLRQAINAANASPAAGCRDRRCTRLNSTLSLHDALPICQRLYRQCNRRQRRCLHHYPLQPAPGDKRGQRFARRRLQRSEVHTSELHSLPTRRSSDLPTALPSMQPTTTTVPAPLPTAACARR